MGHLKTLSLKMLINGVPLFLVLGALGRIGWWPAAILALVVGVASYVLGDLVILPEAGNFTATVADGTLVLFILWLSRFPGVSLSFWGIVLSALVVALAEGLVYHPYLKRLVTVGSMGPRIGKRD